MDGIGEAIGVRNLRAVGSIPVAVVIEVGGIFAHTVGQVQEMLRCALEEVSRRPDRFWTVRGRLQQSFDVCKKIIRIGVSVSIFERCL